MTRWLQKLFHTPTLVVEVERSTPLPPMTPELREAVKALDSHPGFKYLTSKLRTQRAALERELKGTYHKSLREVTNLQAGIQWAAWLEAQVRAELQRPPTEVRQPYAAEQAAFEEVKKFLEVVGA